MLQEIELGNLWKFYKDTPVLKDVSCSFSAGNKYILRGANGSGKTTLLGVLSGSLSAEEGSRNYYVSIECPKEDTEEESREGTAGEKSLKGIAQKNAPERFIVSSIGTIPLYKDLSVNENLKMLLTAFTTTSKMKTSKSIKVLSNLNEDLQVALERFCLEEVKNMRFHSLSKGFQQRTYLASLFLCADYIRKPWILLDEPSVFLDKEGIRLLRIAIRNLVASGGTSIIATHDEEFLQGEKFSLVDIRNGLVNVNDASASLTSFGASCVE